MRCVGRSRLIVSAVIQTRKYPWMRHTIDTPIQMAPTGGSRRHLVESAVGALLVVVLVGPALRAIGGSVPEHVVPGLAVGIEQPSFPLVQKGLLPQLPAEELDVGPQILEKNPVSPLPQVPVQELHPLVVLLVAAALDEVEEYVEILLSVGGPAAAAS